MPSLIDIDQAKLMEILQGIKPSNDAINQHNVNTYRGVQHMSDIPTPPPVNIDDLLKNLQLSGNIGTASSQNSNTLYGNGRVGYGQEVGDGYLSGGLSMGGYKANVNDNGNKQTYQDFGINGADANYSSGKNSYGVQYNTSPMDTLLKLLYTRRL